MRHFIHSLCIIAATLAFGSTVIAQDTFVVKGVFDNPTGQVLWRWIDASGIPHDSGQAEGTANEVDPTRQLNGRLVVSVRNGDKIRFDVEGLGVDHGVIFENGKIETAAASPVWSRLAGEVLEDLPNTSAFSHYDRAKANTTKRVPSGLIIEIEIKDLQEDQPIFFSCRVHSTNGGSSMFGALVLATQKNMALVKRLVATSRMVSTGTSGTLSFDGALRDAISKLPPNPFPDGIRTFSVVEMKGAIGGIAGAQDLSLTILAEDEPAHEAPVIHGASNAHEPEDAHEPEE